MNSPVGSVREVAIDSLGPQTQKASALDVIARGWNPGLPVRQGDPCAGDVKHGERHNANTVIAIFMAAYFTLQRHWRAAPRKEPTSQSFVRGSNGPTTQAIAALVETHAESSLDRDCVRPEPRGHLYFAKSPLGKVQEREVFVFLLGLNVPPVYIEKAQGD